MELDAWIPSFFAYWIHNIDPVAIPFPEWLPTPGIYWYGIAYFTGFLLGGWMLYRYGITKRIALIPDQQVSLLMHLILGILVGGRLGYMLLYDFSNWAQNPLSIFKTWEGGMASHGAVIGLLISGYLFVKKHKQSYWHIGDITVTLAPPGILLGRVANFINGELWGKVTDVPWAIIFPQSMPHLTDAWVQLIPTRHPSQLYEAILEGAILCLYTQVRFWKKKKLPDGQLMGEFFIGYSLLRIIGEVFREPDASLIIGISRGQFYSLLMLLAGIAIFIHSKQKVRNT